MTVQPAEAWDRRPGESSWDFARFCRYRDLGPARSIPDAVRAWLCETPARFQHQRRFRTAADPDDYVRRVTWRWQQISRKGFWCQRVAAFDDRVEEEARQQAILDHIEAEAEYRRLRLTEARAMRRAGREIWQRFIDLIDGGKLNELILDHMKYVVTAPRGSGESSRVERETKSIVELLNVAREGIVAGQYLERLELGEVTEPAVIRPANPFENVPTDRLRRARERLEELLRDEDDPTASSEEPGGLP